MQHNIHYKDVVGEVLQFLERRVRAATSVGAAGSHLVVDPGFGFGKAINENFLLLDGLHRFHSLGLPVLVGMSRKSMIGQATGRPVEQRLAGGIAAASLALERGAAIIRTHDVAATVDAIGVHCQFKKSVNGSGQS